MIFEELFTRGTALNQTVLWVLLAVFAMLTVWTIVDILRWCWFWWKGEDDEKMDYGDFDGSYTDCGSADDGGFDRPVDSLGERTVRGDDH